MWWHSGHAGPSCARAGVDDVAGNLDFYSNDSLRKRNSIQYLPLVKTTIHHLWEVAPRAGQCGCAVRRARRGVWPPMRMRHGSGAG